MDVVSGRVRRKGWSRVARGVHVAEAEPTLPERLAGWSAVLPTGAAFTHLTAAAVRGWWLPATVPHPVFVAVAEREQHPQRRGLKIIRLAAAPAAETMSGLRVATAAETLLACAADLDVLDLVVLGDSALRRRDCTLEELWNATRARRRGTPMLRSVLPLLDPRSESAWESALRVLHRSADVEVEPQHEIRTAAGAFVARADLWLVGTRRIHEYDGADHRKADVHRSDLARDRRLVEDRWERCGYTSRDVLRHGGDIIAAADAALGRPWVPARLEAWRTLVARSLHGSLGRQRVIARWSSANR